MVGFGWDPETYWHREQSVYGQVAGTASGFSSVLLLYCIFKSEMDADSIHGRIMIGLSVADVLESVATGLITTISSPSSSGGSPYSYLDDDYWKTNDFGNTSSVANEGEEEQQQGGGVGPLCKMQSFSFSLGVVASYFYGLSLCIYYVFVIVLEKDEDAHIPKTLEYVFHIVPVLYGLFFATCPLMFKFENRLDDSCIPHPTDCGDGGECDKFIQDAMYGVLIVTSFLNVVATSICVGLVTRKVHKDRLQYQREEAELATNDPLGAMVYQYSPNGRAFAERKQVLAYMVSILVIAAAPFLTSFDNNVFFQMLVSLQGVFNFLIYTQLRSGVGQD
mmetsp:Transcript_17190/g.25017  ORF Transcript_17190/g.25017 Transcript_17190/m.25017 type:complete len:334 (+) Transcript_17190:322-1323(+)